MSILDGFLSLGDSLNKKKTGDTEKSEGLVSAQLPELSLSLTDDELIALSKKWGEIWAAYEPEAKKSWDRARDYWTGKIYNSTEYILENDKSFPDNLLFEALETFLPIATRVSPEPVVSSDGTEDGNKLAENTRKGLMYLADTLRLKLRLKKVMRNWALFKLGVLKVGWNQIKNEIDCKVVKTQDLILDPTATVNEDGEYTGEFIGEKLIETAAKLVVRFPKQKGYITKLVDGKMGSKLGYTEWWTDEYVFWALQGKVLDKYKNPHWNYENEQKEFDEYGNESLVKKPGHNHFNVPKKPFISLAVFNLGDRPFDDTSLIEQNIALQDLVNKRIRQIDKNADYANGCIAVSGDAFDKDQAKEATEAMRRGGAIWVPTGRIEDGVQKLSGVSLPGDVYQSLQDYRNELKNIFGIRASSAAGLANEQTVRGKIISRGMDDSRVGGGVTEYLEQFADAVFNWFVQLMVVYYDEPHMASIVGEEKAREHFQLSSGDFNKKLVVSVKEGSMVPKDPLTQRNEAVDLWNAGALDPITLFERLDFPNPREAASKLIMWKTNPAGLLGEEAVPPMLPGQAPAREGVPSTPAPLPSPAEQPMPQVEDEMTGVPIQ